MRAMFVHKLNSVSAALVLLGITGGGLGMTAFRPSAAQESAPPAAAAPDDMPMSSNKRVDLYGDPLPEGAVMRLGTLQRRAVGALLAVTTDGKSIVGVRAGKRIRIWDAATGELRQKRELPGETWGTSVLSPDGRWLIRSIGGPADHLEIWDAQTGEKAQTLTIKGARFIMPAAFSSDGKRIAAVGHRRTDKQDNHLIRAWDRATGKEIFAADVRNNVGSDLLAFAPDGKRLLASFGSINEGMYCWDIATRRRLWQNKEFGHANIVFTPDGKILSSQQRPRAVNLETGRNVEIAQLPPFNYDTHLTLAPDGRTLLLANNKGVIVWDLKEGKELRTLKGAGEQVVVTPDSKAIITNNGALQRWDLATGKAIWSDTSELGHVGEVAVVKFSLDGKRLVSASTDGTVRLWDTTTGQPLRIWRGHQDKRPVPGVRSQDGVKTIDISADGRRVVSAGTDERVKLWDVASDKEIRTISLPPPEKGEADRHVYQVRLSPDGRRILGYFGAQSGYAAVGQPPPKMTDKLATWNAETGAVLEMRPVEKSGGRGVLSPDARTLLARNTLIDLMSAKVIAELPDMGGFGSAAFSRDGALIVGEVEKVTRKDGNTRHVAPDGLRIWEAATGKVVTRLKTKWWGAKKVFHSDNRFIVTDDIDGIQVRDAHRGEVVGRFTLPESFRGGIVHATCLAFTRDGRRMATGLADSTILVWDVPLPASKPRRLGARELEALWTDLADDDAAKAWRAVWRMAEAPKDALAFLRERVKPYPTAPAEAMRKLLADLDSDSFERREAAVKRLKELGLQAEPALRAALQAKPSLETKRRVEAILAALREMPQSLSANDLRQLRALIVLERIGSPEARRMLEEVAKGPESARLTRQARAALACMR